MSVFVTEEHPHFGFDISDIGDAVSDAGKWVGNAAESVGGAIGDIGEGVGKLTIAPYTLVEKIAQGVPIDKALGRTLEEQIKVIHDLAPYAQIVISIVPGIGPVASGAISAGLALAQGQSIDEILIAGVKGAIPGGPLAAAAFEAAVGIAQGKNVGEVALSQVGNVAAGIGIPIPPAASKVIGAGTNIAQDMVSGKPLDTALLNAAIDQVTPAVKEQIQLAEAEGNVNKVADLLIKHGTQLADNIPPEAQEALEKAVGVGIALGTAKKVKEGAWSPDGMNDPDQMRRQLEEALAYQKKWDAENARWASLTPEQRDKELRGTGTNILPERVATDPNAMIAWALPNAEYVAFSAKYPMPANLVGAKAYSKWLHAHKPRVGFEMPPQFKTMAQAAAWLENQKRKWGPVSHVTRNLTIAKAPPTKVNLSGLVGMKKPLISLRGVVKKAPNIAKTGAAHGAELAQTLLKKHFSKSEFINLRSTLTSDERLGFDLAISNAIGQRMKDAPAGLTPDEKEAYYITKGMQGAPKQLKATMMQTVIDSGVSKGAKVAVQEVATARMSLLDRILHFFGLK